MSVGHRGLHRAGAKEWVLEKEGNHVKQILSESFESCFPFSLYYPYLFSRVCLNFQAQIFFEENPNPCVRQQVQPHGRYKNIAKTLISLGSAWPALSLSY